MRRGLILLGIAACTGCVSVNPDYADGAASDATAASQGVSDSTGDGSNDAAGSTSANGSASAGPVTTSASTSTSTGPEPDGTQSGGTTGGDSSTGSGLATGSSSSSGANGIDFGTPCVGPEDCAGLHDGATCCENEQCFGTCMVPCGNDEDCRSLPGTECEHDHCLFPCPDDDGACAWLGGDYTCQHGGSLCENDLENE